MQSRYDTATFRLVIILITVGAVVGVLVLTIVWGGFFILRGEQPFAPIWIGIGSAFFCGFLAVRGVIAERKRQGAFRKQSKRIRKIHSAVGEYFYLPCANNWSFNSVVTGSQVEIFGEGEAPSEIQIQAFEFVRSAKSGFWEAISEAAFAARELNASNTFPVFMPTGIRIDKNGSFEVYLTAEPISSEIALLPTARFSPEKELVSVDWEP